jgi:hypothetical protein
MSDKSKPPFRVIEGGQSDENWPGTPEYEAAQTRIFFERFPDADFEPAAVGKDITLEQRKRHLLWNDEDLIAAFNDPNFAMEMLDLQDYDDDLQLVVDVALTCIMDLHQFGRVTMHGLGVGVLKTVLKNSPAYAKYFRKKD